MSSRHLQAIIDGWPGKYDPKYFDRDNPLAEELEGYWNFMPGAHGFKSSVAYDLSARGSHVTAMSMTPTDDWTASGLDLDNADDRVTSGPTVSGNYLPFGWILTLKPHWSSGEGTHHNILSVKNAFGDSARRCLLWVAGTGWYSDDVLAYAYNAASTAFSAEEVVQVAFTRSGTNVGNQFYFNGQPATTSKIVDSRTNPLTTPFWNFGYDLVQGLPSNATLVKVSFFGCHLSEAIIEADYRDPFHLHRRPTRVVFDFGAAAAGGPFPFYTSDGMSGGMLTMAGAA